MVLQKCNEAVFFQFNSLGNRFFRVPVRSRRISTSDDDDTNSLNASGYRTTRHDRQGPFPATRPLVAHYEYGLLGRVSDGDPGDRCGHTATYLCAQPVENAKSDIGNCCSVNGVRVAAKG